MEDMDERSYWSRNAKVLLEEGGLFGSLLLDSAPPEGLCLSPEGLQEFIRQNGIQFGIDPVVCQQIAISPGSYVKERVRIAKGKPPVNGKDAQIEIYIEVDGEHRPKILENGRVDYFDMGSVQTVVKGQLLARRIPPTDGQDGLGVNGHPLPAKKGKDYRLPQGRNTVIEEDGCVLKAEKDGHVVYIPKENKIHVLEEFVVQKDVDFSVGNIEFSGSVRVNGNVQPGFKIKAEGDIEVQGYVDAAMIEAGGNVTIRGGVQGRLKGFVKAGGNLKTPFIQNAVVDVGGNCLVGESIMHSNVSAGLKIVMEGRKAVIVGGIVRAGEEVVTRVLGSPMATPTEVEVGVHPHLRSELNAIHESLKELHKNVDKTQKAIALLENMAGMGGHLPPDKAALLQKLKMTHEHYKVEEEEFMLRRSEIEILLQEVKGARVNVFDTVYSGVKITISNYSYFVRDSISRAAFVIKDAEIRTVPL
ncbi:DUF342 domain-containing protein [Effusibacillus lacus]|uniref:Flagellar Assembly Protein A N-terminal region domain-containing protein n=1 Tax=Effusibacillus lacus TaxID=1348429 RepID=A0A292YNR0_9BACL|nr:FapA family protein [Effusibacillus lacus]TCS73146.1 hypothetical protein EDD64_11925 [Effusibacillus lacus]GAX90549.1 hypothetical protein EFBL_2176 [Effusibacillus lacus]